jgi:hypothetical protein
MQSLFERDESTDHRRTLLEQLAEQEESKPKDSFFGVRLVLLIAAGIATFTLPWPIAAFLFLCWILVMVWPH